MSRSGESVVIGNLFVFIICIASMLISYSDTVNPYFLFCVSRLFLSVSHTFLAASTVIKPLLSIVGADSFTVR